MKNATKNATKNALKVSALLTVVYVTVTALAPFLGWVSANLPQVN